VLNLEQMLLFSDKHTDGYTRIRQTFGEQVCFTLNVDSQRTLPDGTPEEITCEVEHIFRVFDSPKGGFIPFADVGKDHYVRPSENLALVEMLFERYSRHT